MRLWDPATGQPVGDPLTGHTDAVTGVAFAPGRPTLLASASDDRTVRLWDPATGDPVGDPLTGHTGAVTAVAFGRRTGTLLATASDDRTVRLWDPATGAPGRRPADRPHRRGDGGGVRPLPTADPLLATASGDETVRLWDPATGAPGRRPADRPHRRGDRGGVRPAPTAPCCWPPPATTGRCGCGTRPPAHPVGDPLTGHTDAVTAVAFGPARRPTLLATASDDRTVRLWDPATGAPVGDPLTGHTGAVTAVAFDARTGPCCWPPPATTGRCGCGTRPPAQLLRRSTHHGGGLQPLERQMTWLP